MTEDTASVGAIDVSGAVSAAASNKAGGGSTATALAAAGSVFGPIGTLVGGALGSLFGGSSGPCKSSNQNPQIGAVAPVTDAQANAWVQAEGKQSLVKTWQKCQSAWGGISWGEFIAWHWAAYRQKHKYRTSPYDYPGGAPAPAPAAPVNPVAQVETRAPAAVQYPARAATLYSGGGYTGFAPVVAAPAPDPSAAQRAQQRALVQERLAQFRAALANAETNYQRAYQLRDAGAAQDWATYHQQVAAGVAQLEQLSIQLSAP